MYLAYASKTIKKNKTPEFKMYLEYLADDVDDTTEHWSLWYSECKSLTEINGNKLCKQNYNNVNTEEEIYWTKQYNFYVVTFLN